MVHFGRRPPSEVPAASEEAQIGRRLAVGLHGARCGQQHAEFDQRRRGPPAVFGGALEDPVFVSKAQRAHPAGVIDRQQEVERVERARFTALPCPARLLPPFGVVAQDHAARPAVRFGVGDRAVEDRSMAALAMELRAGHQRQAGFERKAVRGGQPLGVVFERGVLTCALNVIAKRGEAARVVAQGDGDGPLHSAVGAFFGRTRLGRRSTSSSRPTSSRRGSTISPIASPKPGRTAPWRRSPSRRRGRPSPPSGRWSWPRRLAPPSFPRSDCVCAVRWRCRRQAWRASAAPLEAGIPEPRTA